MYFASENDFADLERECRLLMERLQRPVLDHGMPPVQQAMLVARLADYNLMVSAGNETRIDAVAVKENGDFLAATFRFGAVTEHKVATGSVFTAQGSAFSATLATVQAEFLASQGRAQAA